MTVGEGETIIIASKVPADAVVTWASSDIDLVTVNNGYVEAHGTESGTATVTASITVNGVTYSDSCVVTVLGYE